MERRAVGISYAVVLAAIDASPGRSATGREIAHEYVDRYAGSPGGVYVLLGRMEDGGYIRILRGTGSPSSPFEFGLTASGRRALTATRKAIG